MKYGAIFPKYVDRTYCLDHLTNEIQQIFQSFLLLPITLTLILFLLETSFFCSLCLQISCLFPMCLVHIQSTPGAVWLFSLLVTKYLLYWCSV